jgi:hypothetical protein
MMSNDGGDLINQDAKSLCEVQHRRWATKHPRSRDLPLHFVSLQFVHVAPRQPKEVNV